MKKALSILFALCILLSIPTASFAATKPASTSISSLSAKVGGFKVSWYKRSKVTGYQIQYATKSNFSNAKKKTISDKTKTSKTITGLKQKKRYYVRVRTYVKKSNGNVYSSWSKKKSITTKASASTTVYITPTGKKYHKNSHCNGGTYIKSTLKEAKRRGLTPCSKCC